MDQMNISLDFVFATIYKKYSNKYFQKNHITKNNNITAKKVLDNKIYTEILFIDNIVINSNIGITIKS